MRRTRLGEGLAVLDRERRPPLFLAIVEATINRFLLFAAVDADESPRQVIVHGRARARWDDEGKEAQRSVSRRGRACTDRFHCPCGS